MSASEKLKALDEKAEHPAGKAFGLQRTDVAIPLSRALPQIVAVVEAAENVTFYGQEAHRYNEWHGSQIMLALAALEEALS